MLQPRVTPSLPIGARGLALPAHLLRPGGIDPYAAAVSDVYQDLFGEGSYTGKGIYDVDAFEAALAGRVPEIDAAQPRPVRGHLRARRPRLRHRGGRGVSRPLRRRPPRASIAGRAATGSCCRGSAGTPPATGPRARRRSGRSAAGRCSTTCGARCRPPPAVVALLAGWTLPLPARARLDGFRPARRSRCPTLLPVLAAILPRRAGITARSHLRRARPRHRLAAAQTGCWSSPSSPHQAWLMVDAIVRTLFRLFVTPPPPARMGHGRPGAATARALDLAGLLPARWPAALARRCRWPRSSSGTHGRDALARRRAVRARLVRSRRPSRAGSACRPGRAGQRRDRRRPMRRSLRLIARRTWRFFETFVTAEEHMLPPDNFQEDPKPVVAHRTSPTNIGLYLLSAVTARDFGWIGTLDADRAASRRRFATMDAAGALPRPLLQLVRHDAISGRSSPPTSPRSTAATSPAT